MVRSPKRLIYRCWRYFRTGFSTYISAPLSVFNFLTVTFYLMIERIPILKVLLPHFFLFALFGLVLLVPVSTLLGYLHMRRTMIYGTEAILSVTSNPLNAFTQIVLLDMARKMYEALGIEPSEDWYELYEYWRKINEKWKWRPSG